MKLNQSNFSVAFANWISQTAGVEFSVDDLYGLPLHEYLQIYIRVTNLDGRQIAAGRDLKVLQRDTRQLLSSQRALNQTKSADAFRAWQFDDIPTQASVERGGVRYVVFPALEDRGEGVVLVECATADQAKHHLHFGILRLLIMSLPQQYKFIRQQVTSNRELSLLAQGLQLDKALPDAVAERIFLECFLKESAELPRSRSSFEKLMNGGRPNLDKTTIRTIANLTALFSELRKARQLIGELQGPTFITIVNDVTAQMQLLYTNDFLRSTPVTWFTHLSRYAQAIVRRLERLRGNAARDAELSKQVTPFVIAYKKINAVHSSAEIEQFKWMIEEFRVSLFAQDLKTSIPVSAKRLSEQLVVLEKSV